MKRPPSTIASWSRQSGLCGPADSVDLKARPLRCEEVTQILGLAGADLVGAHLGQRKPVEVRCRTCGGLSRIRIGLRPARKRTMLTVWPLPNPP
jgi:hypothetical protein